MEKPATPEDPLYDENEAADYMRSNVGTLRNNRYKKIGCNYLKLGGRIFYTKKMMDSHIKASIQKCA